MADEPRAPRLHVVTGKGGVGKTTVAAALAIALARTGQRVLLVEVEQRDGFERLLGIPPLEYAETRVPDVKGLYAVALDPRRALQEYLESYYKLGVAGKLVDRAGAVDFAASIAPGLRDVLITGKIYEATRRLAADGRPEYDAVVVDAPPTGRVTKFLNVNAEVSGLARVGPVHQQATKVTTLLHSPITVVHLVTLAEEMPVSETLEALDELVAGDLRPGLVICNQLREQVLTLAALKDAERGSLDLATVATGLRTAGLGAGVGDLDAVAQALAAEAAAHAERVDAQREQEARLKPTGRPIVRLPHLPGGVHDRDALEPLLRPLDKAIRKAGYLTEEA